MAWLKDATGARCYLPEDNGPGERDKGFGVAIMLALACWGVIAAVCWWITR